MMPSRPRPTPSSTRVADRHRRRPVPRALRRRRRVARRARPPPVRARRLPRHRHALLVLLPGGRSVRGPVLPARDARAAEREPRAGGRRRVQQDRRSRSTAARTSSRPTAAVRMPRTRCRASIRRSAPIGRARRPHGSRGSSRPRSTATHRPYGYLYGGSGGAYRTIGSSENTERRLGRLRAVRSRQPDGDAERLQRAHARPAHPPRRVPRDRRRLRRRRRPVSPRPDPGAGGRARRGHPHGVPAAVVVRVAARWACTRSACSTRRHVHATRPTPTTSGASTGYLGADPSASVHRDRVQLTTTIAELIAEHGDARRGPRRAAASTSRSCTPHRPVQVVSACGSRMLPRVDARRAAAPCDPAPRRARVIRLSGVDGDRRDRRARPGRRARRSRVGDEVAARQLELPRRADLPPAPGARSRVRGLGPVPRRRRRARSTRSGRCCSGRMFTQGAVRHRADGTHHRQDDRRRLPARPRGVPLAGRLVPRRASRSTSATPRTSGSGSGTSTTPCTAMTTRRSSRPAASRYVGALEAALRQLAAWVEDGVEPSPTTVVRGRRRSGGRRRPAPTSGAACSPSRRSP